MASRTRLLFLILSSILSNWGSCAAVNKNGPSGGSQLSKLAQPINTFSFKLLHTLQSLRGSRSRNNIFYSPLSICSIFGMVGSGARGRTQRQIINTMEFYRASRYPSHIHPMFRELLSSYKELDENSMIDMKWTSLSMISEKFTVRQSFVNNLKNNYFGVMTGENFIENPDQIMDSLNAWVLEGTDGHIRQLISHPLDRDTIMILLNAIYFRSKWSTTFDPTMTKFGKFFNIDRTETEVKFMQKTGRLGYISSPQMGIQIVGIPLVNDIAMYVVVPEEKYGLKRLTKKLKSKQFDQLLKEIQMMNVQLTLPKFDFEYQVDLDRILPIMGLTSPFSVNADFRGLTMSQRVRISKAIHRAKVTVNEEGMAADTSLSYGSKSGLPNIIADHPFLFIIHDNLNGVNLFMGVINRLKY